MPSVSDCPPAPSTGPLEAVFSFGFLRFLRHFVMLKISPREVWISVLVQHLSSVFVGSKISSPRFIWCRPSTTSSLYHLLDLETSLEISVITFFFSSHLGTWDFGDNFFFANFAAGCATFACLGGKTQSKFRALGTGCSLLCGSWVPHLLGCNEGWPTHAVLVFRQFVMFRIPSDEEQTCKSRT